MQNFYAKTSQKVRSLKTKKEMREGDIKMDFWEDCTRDVKFSGHNAVFHNPKLCHYN
jgi:hypothetical protein